MNRTLLPACLLSACLLAPFVRAGNWPQWRGPERDGVSPETGLPAAFGPGQNMAWKLPLPGRGGSTPVVWGDRIFLTSEDGKDIVLLCAGTDGKERWKRKLGTAGPRPRGDEGDSASASPSTDGKHVYAFAGSGELACFDFDGKEVWKYNTQDRYGRFKIQFGLHSTPLLYGDRLYLQLIHSGGAWVIAVDKLTGQDVWKVARKSDGRAECEHSYASVTLWKKGDEAVLISHGNDYAIGHSLDDGRELWRVGGLNPKTKYNPTLRFVASPVATPELIVIPSAKVGPVVGLKPTARGLVMPGSEHERWRNPSNTPDVSCPLVHDGLVYLCRETGGVVHCLEAATGKELYTERIHSAKYRASPVYADGKVYLTSRDGYVTTLKAGPKFEVLAENRLGDDVTASPAISNGRIYVRGFQALYAFSSGGK